MNRFRPTNYEEPGSAGIGNFVPGDGAGPYEAALFLFDGSTPDGTWELFVRDDTSDEMPSW